MPQRRVHAAIARLTQTALRRVPPRFACGSLGDYARRARSAAPFVIEGGAERSAVLQSRVEYKRSPLIRAVSSDVTRRRAHGSCCEELRCAATPISGLRVHQVASASRSPRDRMLAVQSRGAGTAIGCASIRSGPSSFPSWLSAGVVRRVTGRKPWARSVMYSSPN